MSITFWAPDAPTKKTRPFEDEPDYEETVSELPELNISNANARVFLRLLALPDDDAGTIEHAILPQYARLALALLNDERSRMSAERAPSEAARVLRTDLQGNVATLSFGPRMVDCGLSSQQLERYARTFADLAVQAHQGGYSVSWG